jgi:hypothetical protein
LYAFGTDVVVDDSTWRRVFHCGRPPDCARDDRVRALADRIVKLGQNSGAQQPRDEAAEKAAAAIYEKLRKFIGDGEIDGAREARAELSSRYSNTTAYRRARKLERELEIIGKDAPLNLVVEKWYLGEFRGAKTEFNTDRLTLLIFWEVWCPHSQREVPKMQRLWNQYGTDMNMVGLTKITRSATEEKVQESLNENSIF